MATHSPLKNEKVACYLRRMHPLPNLQKWSIIDLVKCTAKENKSSVIAVGGGGGRRGKECHVLCTYTFQVSVKKTKKGGKGHR